MKFPSIHYLKEQSLLSLKRFPFTLSSAFIGVSIAVFLVEQQDSIDDILPLLNVVLSSAIGIPLFFCVKVFTEKRNWSFKHLQLSRVIVLAVLVLLYFSMPNSSDGSAIAIPYIRYAVYNLCAHLLVAFLPYSNRGEINGFWQYNKMLFVRFLASALYSAVLHIGLVLAIVAIDQLFEFEINERIYFQLFIIISGVFNTWFFLSKIPTDLNVLEKDTSYPNALRIFAQYVLSPLLLVYLLILYSYISKIVYLWDWPEGIVSYMIICVSVVGILTFLLLYPYRIDAHGGWIPKFEKAYYILLIPLILVLFMAIGIRVNDYGITINRYILITIGIWLSLISVYFIFGRASIKLVPISLAIFALIISFGPWSMFAVSEHSQVQRLTNILETSGVIKSNRVAQEVTWDEVSSKKFNLKFDIRKANDKLLTDSLHNEVKSIIDYLNEFHGLASLNIWFQQGLPSKIDNYNSNKKQADRVNRAEIYMEALGFEYRTIDLISTNKYINYRVKESSQYLDVSNHQYLVELGFYANSDAKNDIKTFTYDTVEFNMKMKNNVLQIYNGAITMNFDFAPLFKLKDHTTYDKMTINESENTFNGRLVLKSLNAVRENGQIEIKRWYGFLLLANPNKK